MDYVGKAVSGEDLIVVAERGDRAKIIFEADGGYFRMGWVFKNSLAKYFNSGSSDLPESLDDYADDGADDFSDADMIYDDEK